MIGMVRNPRFCLPGLSDCAASAVRTGNQEDSEPAFANVGFQSNAANLMASALECVRLLVAQLQR